MRILLIISGGIAAYKALELIRLLRGRGHGVTCVLTTNGGQFVTPLSLQALSEGKVYTDLFSLTDESEMGHIQLSRSADLVVVAPASADILAKMATGLANDLASTLLLATDKSGAGGAGDERAHVAASGDAGQHGDAARPRRAGGRPGRGRDGLQRIRPRPPGRTARHPCRHRGFLRLPQTAFRQTRVGHQRPNARADRPGTLHRQPLVRPAGPRHRRRARRDWAHG